MGSLKLTTASSGSVILSPANTASDVTITVPAVTGTMATIGPAFSAYSNANQNISTGTTTKVAFQTEEFDTASCYDASAYRFTPNVAGYYQVNTAHFYNIAPTSLSCAIYIFKNGSPVRQAYGWGSNAAGWYTPQLSGVIYMNGTTDYLEIYTYQQSGSTLAINSGITTFFSASMIRAA